MMKKKQDNWIRVVWIAVFFVCFGILFVLLSYLYRPVTSSRENICGFYAEEKNSLDMVYVGGSACYVYWEALAAYEQYGFTSYNFATDAMPPQVIKYCIEEILKTQTPEVFLVDLRPFQYGDRYDEATGCINYKREAPLRNVTDNMNYSLNRFQMIENCVEEGKTSYHFDIAKYHSLLVSLIMPDNWEYIRNRHPMQSKGFHPCETVGELELADVSAVTEKQQLAPRMDDLLIDLLEYCKEKELKVLFIVHAYQISEEDQKKYNYMEEKISGYGLDYLNTNDYIAEIGLDGLTDFYNRDHVNLLGADKYTKFLGDYLVRNYTLGDKRGDTAYSQWGKDYEEWNRQMEEIRNTLRQSEGNPKTKDG